MFKMNKVVKTKSGESVKPFAVQGDIVYCFNKDGETVRKKIQDFDFSKEEEKEVVDILPSRNEVEVDESKNEDELFEEDKEKDDELYEDEEKDEEVKDDSSEKEPKEEESDEEEEDDKDSGSGSIWDDIDDDGYI